MAGLTYLELMTLDLDHFSTCGNRLAAVLSSVAAAEHTFSTAVVDAGTDKSTMDRLVDGTSKLSALTGLTIDGGNIVHTTVENVAKALGKSPDANVRSSTLKIMQILEKGSAFTESDIAELISKKALPVVDALVSAAEYSRDSKNVVEVAEKTGITMTASVDGASGGAALALPICGVLNADDGEIGLPACETVLGGLLTLIGGKAGELVGDKINEGAFDATEGTPDPFAVQYRTKH